MDHNDQNVQANRKNDKVGEYLTHHLDKMLFDELSDEYLKKAGMTDILKGVPIPFKAEQITGGATSTLMIASNMAYVIGCDRCFKYRDNYLAYINKTFPHDFDKPLLNEGVKAAQNEDPETACIYFRAALQIAPDSQDALFLYARACKDAYENGDGEDYIGTFKAESIRMFERLTINHPDFDQGYYFLGYGYLNLGLYTKAKLTFEEFMRVSMKNMQGSSSNSGQDKNGASVSNFGQDGNGASEDASEENDKVAAESAELRAEVAEVLDKLQDPCRIEGAINDITAGRYEKGIFALEPYTRDERFTTYWPMWYYLGIAYRAGGNIPEAERHLVTCLRYSPSNTDVMNELVEIYEDTGDAEKAKKYRDKIDIVDHNRKLDQIEKESEKDGLQ